MEVDILKIKPFLIVIYCSIIYLIIISVSYSSPNSSERSVIYHIMTRLHCEKEDAVKFISIVESFINEIQDNITTIASNNNIENNDKQYLINYTINRYFLSTSSQVQVSSIYRNIIRSYRIDTYLNRLSNLSKTKYTRVQLLFAPNYLALGNIESYTDNELGQAYEFNVKMWQIFRAYFGDSIAYEDATLKSYSLVFYKKTDRWDLKVKNIAAKETVTLDELEQRIEKRWRLE